MTLWLIGAMTLLAFMMLNAWFSQRQLVIGRTGDVFMLTWFYYGFAVAIDVLLGLEIRGVPGMTDFSDELSRELLVYVLGYYLLCGVAFFLTYWGAKKNSRVLHAGRPILLPPLSALLFAHVVLLLLLAQAGYFGLTRPQRILLISDSLTLRLMLHSMAILRAIDLLAIIFSNRKSYVVGTTLAAVCLGLASGGRMELMAIVLILVLKYRLSCGRVRFAAAVVALLVVFACWKSVYSYVYDNVVGTGTNREVLEFANTSLSGIDSYASSLIAVTAIEDDCPSSMGNRLQSL